MKEKWDIAILGAGPGGYVAALRAAQLKKRVVLVERDKVGGICMNYGCISTKYLLHQAKIYEECKKNGNLEGPLEKIHYNWQKVQAEKERVVQRLVRGIEFLLKRNGVTLIQGDGSLRDERHIVVRSQKEEIRLESDKIILAAGSRPSPLPFLAANSQEVITSRQALELESIPKRMLIVGAGAVGLEIGSIFQRLGSEVHILEIMPSILPGADKEVTSRLEKLLKIQGLNIYTQMRIEESLVKDGKVHLKGTCLKDQIAFDFEAEKVLLAAGRTPNSQNIKGENINFSEDKFGFLKVSPSLETSVPGIYAVGDLAGGKLLAHKASHEGLIAAENASGAKKEISYEALPMAVYTEPEFSAVGLTAQEAEERGIKVQVGLFSLQASGRALTMGKKQGMVKIIADAKDRIIGAHILSPNASELIAEIALAVHMQMKLQDVSSSMHVHPTLSEAVMEAAMKAKGEAIHVLNT